jgi:hypothetical protein
MELGGVVGKPLGRVVKGGRSGKRFWRKGFWPRFCSMGTELRWDCQASQGLAVDQWSGSETREKQGGYDDISHGQVND